MTEYSDLCEHEAQIRAWLREDLERCRVLEAAAELRLNDWCLAAGFVRNLVWDKLHGYGRATPLNDIDLLYFDQSDRREEVDKRLEASLKAKLDRPWSVKNQARMHRRNGDGPYQSTSDAMNYWVERETALGVRLCEKGNLQLIAPFGFASLFDLTVSLNPQRPKREAFRSRLRRKGWLMTWPELTVKLSD